MPSKVLSLIYRVRDEASAPLKAIRSQQTGFAGDLKAFLPTGLAVAGMMAKIGEEYLAQIERGRQLINTVDDLADKFQLTTEEAGPLVNFMKIMSVDASALEMAFKTMSKQGIDPTLAGLREVKTRLDAIEDPGQRTAETVKLLGKSGLELSETLGLTNDEFDRLIELAKEASLVTADTAAKQDAFNREMALYKIVIEQANVVSSASGRNVVQNAQKWWYYARAVGQVRLALEDLGVRVTDEQDNLQRLLEILHANTQKMLTWEERNRAAAAVVRGHTVSLEEQATALGITLETLQSLRPYLDNEINFTTRGLSEAEAGAQRLLGYLKELNDRKWGVFVGGKYVGPDVPSPSSGGGGTNVQGANGSWYNNAKVQGGVIWVWRDGRWQNTGQKAGGFAHGGEFLVGGGGGADSQLVQFAATPGEKVKVGEAASDKALLSEIRGLRSDLGRLGASLPTLLRDAVERSR